MRTVLYTKQLEILPDTLICLIKIDQARGLPDLPDQELAGWEVVPDLRKQDLLSCFVKSILLPSAISLKISIGMLNRLRI